MELLDPEKFEEHTGITPFQYTEYIIKCVVGVAGSFLLFLILPIYRDDIFWVIISLMLSVTHDNNSKVAFDRMKGNTIGPLVGLGCWTLQNYLNKGKLISIESSTAALICILIGVVLIITICTATKLITVSRTALVGFFIVMIYEDDHHSWQGAIMRVVSVMIGCLIGLCINKTFKWGSEFIFRTPDKGPENPPQKENKEDKIY